MEMSPPTTVLSFLSASIVYPATFLLSITLSLLEYLSSLLLHLASQVSHILLFPIRVLVKLEPLITYFGVAALFGALAGYMLHRTLDSVYQALGISTAAAVARLQQEKPRPLVAESLKKREEVDVFDSVKFRNGSWTQKASGEKAERAGYPRWLSRSRDVRKRSILEEEDESDV